MTTNAEIAGSDPVELPVDRPIWERFFLPSPLVLIGTKEGEGFDLAPKHMAMPIGWENYFGFVCTPRHSTYHNVLREQVFTVSFPRPNQLVITSLAAQPRGVDGETMGLESLPTESAHAVEGILLQGAYLQLECELDRICDDFGPNSLIVGKVLAARADPAALRESDGLDEEVLMRSPLLVYLNPGRFSEVSESRHFPFPADFSR
jgi:flavin reductase (DIM6/NTAB) family NADH-FMN oxidoreductase RutF